MANKISQGNGYKVAGTQETTAQNSANQGKKNFDGNKDLFNAVNEQELIRALGNYDFGIVRPEYIVSNLKMAQRFIDKARIPDDQKAVLRNGYGFLLGAIISTYEPEEWEHIANNLYPEDIEEALEEAGLEYDDYAQLVLGRVNDEIATVLGEAWEMYDNDPDNPNIGLALEVVQNYIDEWEENTPDEDLEIDERLAGEYCELYNKYNKVYSK